VDNLQEADQGDGWKMERTFVRLGAPNGGRHGDQLIQSLELDSTLSSGNGIFSVCTGRSNGMPRELALAWVPKTPGESDCHRRGFLLLKYEHNHLGRHPSTLLCPGIAQWSRQVRYAVCCCRPPHLLLEGPGRTG
jgi:hypothetical protein